MPRRLFLGVMLLTMFMMVFTASAQDPTPIPTPSEYVLRSGESLSSVAARFNTSVRAIALLNSITNVNLIYAGQRILIPPPDVPLEILAQTAQPPAQHTIRAGDTLAGIASLYGTTVEDLIALNELQAPYTIFAGQTLKIREQTNADGATPTVAAPADAQPTATPAPSDPTATPTADAQPAAPTPTIAAPSAVPNGAFAYGVVAFVPNANTEQFTQQVQGLGMAWVRLNVNWRDVEVLQGQPDFAALDPVIEALSAAGLRVMLTVSTSPTWARADQTEDGPPDDYAPFGMFVGQLAARYNGKVQAIQIWNEPNLRREWFNSNHRLSAEAYVNLLRVAHQAIKAANPSMLVIAAGLAPTGFNDGVNAIDDRLYLEEMYRRGVITVTDAIAAHPGGWGNPPNSTCCTPSVGVESHYDNRTFFFKDTLDDYRIIMQAYGDVRPLWVTEFGWGTVENANLPPVGESYQFVNYNSLNEQALYAVRAFQLGRESGFVGPMFLNNFNGCISDATRIENCYYSLIGPDGVERPAYSALQVMPKD